LAQVLRDGELRETGDLQGAHMVKWLLVAVLLGGCGATTAWRAQGCWTDDVRPVAPARGGTRTRNVVLITIDGVRWQEIFKGVEAARAKAAGLADCDVVPPAALVPNLTALAATGVAIGSDGGEMVSSGPNFVSLPGYRELLTGRAGGSCTHNLCGPIDERTLLDELRGDEPAVIASWEKLNNAAARDLRVTAVSAGRHGGATRDRLRVSPRASALLDEAAHVRAYPGWLDYRPDRYTSALALEYLKVKRPRFLHVALGDTDERAHRGDYPGYLEALRAADRFVGELTATLRDLGEYGEETVVIVTTDHGRAHDFRGHGGHAAESARVWLVAAGGSIPAEGAVTTSRKLALADVAPTLRVFLDLPADRSPHAGSPIVELRAPGLLTAAVSPAISVR
jgi:hypothetical protein